MALIVSIETSSRICSVALHREGRLLASGEVHIPQSHASRLLSLVDEILEMGKVKRSDLEAVALSAGPGSYTGLRIGTSVVKGLCYGLGLPLIAVNTLDVMVQGFIQTRGFSGLLCPMLDARRMEVYVQLVGALGHPILPVQSLVLEPSSFEDFLAREKVAFMGDGARKLEKILRHPNASFFPEIYPRAEFLGFLAEKKWENKDWEDLLLFEPFYMKEFLIKKPH